MFEISLRKCSAEMNRVDKSSAMSDLLSIYGTLKEGCSLYEPSIRVKLSPEKMFGYNYAYIDAFKRYYFIKEVSTDVNGYVLLDMVTDVLMTFKDQFKSCSAFVLRNQNKYNTYLVDRRLPLTNRINVSSERGKKVWDTTESEGGANGLRIVFVLASNAGSAYNASAIGGIKIGSGYGIYDGNDTDVSFLSSYRQPHNNGINVVIVTAKTAAHMLEFLASRDKGVNLFNGTVLSIYTIPPLSFDKKSDKSYLVSAGFRELKTGDALVYLKTDAGQEVYEFSDDDTAFVLTGSEFLPYVEQTFTVHIVDFLDLPPYKSYNLILPYAGTLNISETWFDTSVATQTITVRAAIDWTLCEIAYYITVNDIYCTTVSGQFGSLVPFTTTNLSELAMQTTAADTRTIGKLISAGVNTLGGFLAGNFMASEKAPLQGVGHQIEAVTGGVSSVVTSIADYDATINSMVQRAQSTPASSVYLNCNTPRYISLVTQYTPKPEMSDFRALNGSPLLEFSKISDMKGYTEFGVVHLDGVIALKPELEELERKLREGVIL